MGLNRKVGFIEGIKYQGGGPMLAWLLHRISGLAIITFVGLHVISSFFMQQLGSDWATAINIIYESWWFQIVVAFVVIFHSLNGLRIAILDIWPKYLMYQREALWLQWLIFIPVYGLTIFILVQNSLAGG
jgi:succinate dehydrogenase / fumarate reductase cytochrome b subunit